MFKFLGKTINFISYIVLMITGILLLVGFLALALAFVFGAQVMMEWVNNAYDEIYYLINNTDPDFVIPEWVAYLFALPFLVFSFLGLSIILLTQRTARLGRHVNKAAKKAIAAEKVNESDYGTLSKSELMELLDENDIDYKTSWAKAKLVELAEKKI